MSIKFLCVTLPHMSISAGVVRAIALQQIDHAPHAKASAEGDHKGLQSGDGRSEKLHMFLRFSGVKAPAMKKAAHMGRQPVTSGRNVPKLYTKASGSSRSS